TVANYRPVPKVMVERNVAAKAQHDLPGKVRNLLAPTKQFNPVLGPGRPSSGVMACALNGAAPREGTFGMMSEVERGFIKNCTLAIKSMETRSQLPPGHAPTCPEKRPAGQEIEDRIMLFASATGGRSRWR